MTSAGANHQTNGMVEFHAKSEPKERIFLASISQTQSILDVFATTFADDPFVDWLLRPGRGREHALRIFFDYVLSVEGFPNSNVIRDADGAAHAIWLQSGEYGLEAEVVSPLSRLKFIVSACSVWRAHRFFRLIHLSKSTMPKEKHCYLQFFCVDPQRQNRGLGRRLMEKCLAYFDDIQLPTYLEASNPRNVPFYERLGYQVVGSYSYSSAYPVVALMWRDPR